MSHNLHILQTHSIRKMARFSVVFLTLSVGLIGAIEAADKPGAKSSTNRSAQKQTTAKIDPGQNAELIKKMKEVVDSCQTLSELARMAAEMAYSAKYDLELVNRRIARAEYRLDLTEIDYIEARDAAVKAGSEAQKELLVRYDQCKKAARVTTDESAKTMNALYSSAGLGREVQAFLVAWYSALEATGTDRFKAQQSQLETTSENLKLAVNLKSK